MASGGDYRALSRSPTVGVGRSPRMPPPPPVTVAAGPTIGVGTASTGAAHTNVTMGVGTTPLVKQPRSGRGDRILNQAQMQQKLEEILRQQTVAGRRITTTNTITATYKNGQRSTVTSNSTSYVTEKMRTIMRRRRQRKRQQRGEGFLDIISPVQPTTKSLAQSHWRRQRGGDLVSALSTLAPIGKGAVLGLVRALGKRAVKTGIRAGTGAAMGAAGAGVSYGVRKLVKKRKKRR